MGYENFAEFYDTLTENVGYSERAGYICSLLSREGKSGGLLLDLACGTGSLSIEFAKRGYSVIGVDNSEEMLSEAQNKMYESGQNILFLCQDMRELDLFGTIDCAVCALDSLNHLPDLADIETVFLKVFLFLNPGGKFIFDVNTLYKHREILGNNSFIYDCGDIFCAWQNTILDDRASIDIDLDFFRKTDNGLYERFSETLREKAYEPEKIEKALIKSGFSNIRQYSELTENTPDDKTERIVFLAEKGN